MSQEKIWGILLHLTATMWPKGDPDSRDSYNNPNKEEVYRNCETLSYDPKRMDSLLELLPQKGFNTVMLDVGNGVQYERHPEISQKEALTKDQLKAMCERIRALGMDPIPKLNFSCCHNPWLKKYSRMVGTDEYYQVTRDCIDEVMEIFGSPKYFHLGLDEENPSMLGGYGFRNARFGRIWWRDAYRLFDYCEHHNTRPWVWSDIGWDYPDDFKKNMPKSVLQSNWFYPHFPNKDKEGRYLHHMCRFYQLLDEWGYDQVPTSSTWASLDNIDNTFDMCKNELKPELVKGVLTAPWVDAKDEAYYILLQEAELFQKAKEQYYPQD